MHSLTRPVIRRTLDATTNNAAGRSTSNSTGTGGGTGRGFPGVNGQIAE